MQIQSFACSVHDRSTTAGYRVVEVDPAVGLDRWRVCEVTGCRNWAVSLVTETNDPEYNFQEPDPIAYLIGAGIAAVIIGGFAGAEAWAERRAAKRAKAVEDKDTE